MNNKQRLQYYAIIIGFGLFVAATFFACTNDPNPSAPNNVVSTNLTGNWTGVSSDQHETMNIYIQDNNKILTVTTTGGFVGSGITVPGAINADCIWFQHDLYGTGEPGTGLCLSFGGPVPSGNTFIGRLQLWIGWGAMFYNKDMTFTRQ